MWWGTIERLIFPPGGILLLLLAACFLWRRPLGRWLAALCALALYASSTPAVSGWLVAQLQYPLALPEQSPGNNHASAIIILAGGSNSRAPEYGFATVSPQTLERIRYGSRLKRQTELPVLVTGGDPAQVGVSEASLMATALQQDFGMEVAWVEQRSRNTEENARYSRELLAPAGIDAIILVTSALHMPRALASFQRAGFDRITPAPTSFIEERPQGVRSWLPYIHALHNTHNALHELVGRVWYHWHYGD